MNLLVIVDNNFQDVELTTVVSILKRSQQFNKIAFYNPCSRKATGQFEIVKFNNLETSVNLKDYQAVFVPGGKACFSFKDNKEIIKKVRHFFDKDKWVFAICDAPNALRYNNLIKEQNYTSFPSAWSKELRSNSNYQNKGVVVFEKLITAKSSYYSQHLAFEIIRTLFGEKEYKLSKKLAKG